MEKCSNHRCWCLFIKIFVERLWKLVSCSSFSWTGVTLYLPGLTLFFLFSVSQSGNIWVSLVPFCYSPFTPLSYGHDSYPKFCFRCFLLLDLCTKLPLSRKLLVSRLDIEICFWTSCLVEKRKWCLNSLPAVITCQALVQFTDVETASAARSALDGRSIPKYAFHSCVLAKIYSSVDDFFIFCKIQISASRTCCLL